MKNHDIENGSAGVEMTNKTKAVTWNVVSELVSKNNQAELRHLIENNTFSSVFFPQKAPRYQTALHKAAELENITSLKYLCEHPQFQNYFIDYPDHRGNSPLFSAVSAGNLEGLKYLDSLNIFINARNNNGNSVLHEIVNFINTSIENENKQKNTERQLAEKERQEKIIGCLDYLLDKNEIDLEAHNLFGLTPITYTAQMTSSTNKEILSIVCDKLNSKLASFNALINTKQTAQKLIDQNKSSNEMAYTAQISKRERDLFSKFLDALILGKSFQEISDLFKGKSLNIRKQASNLFLGSCSVLFYVVNKGENSIAKFLLHEEANSMFLQPSGQLCLHRAFSRGNLDLLNLLITNMKNSTQSNPLDLTLHSFELIEIFFTNAKYSKTASYDTYLACLKRLLQSDIEIDLNARDPISKETILQLATKSNNKHVLELMIVKGIFIGKRKFNDESNSTNLLETLNLSILNNAMDNCITHHNDNSTDEETKMENIISLDYTLSLNYKFLIPPDDSKNKNVSTDFNEVKTLREIGQLKTIKNALTHPLLQAFVYIKWHKIMPLFWVSVAMYFFFGLFLTLFMYSLTDLRMIEEALLNNTENATLREMYGTKDSEVTGYMSILLLFTIYMFFRELFQIIFTFKTYRKNFENVLEWFLILVVILLCSISFDANITRNLAAWAMIFAWLNFVYILGRHPSVALYVTMLRKVTWNFFKFILLFCALIFAFSVSFNILLHTSEPSNSFVNFWVSVPRLIVMSTGEFEYNDLSKHFFNSNVLATISVFLIFIFFLFLIFLVLMNVLNGLAVSNTQEIMDDSILYSLKSRLELIYLIEELLLSNPSIQTFLFKVFGFTRNILGGRNGYPEILVEVNRRTSKEELKNGPSNRFKLSKKITAPLKDHRLKYLKDKESETNSDSLKECLSLMKEIKQTLEKNNAGI